MSTALHLTASDFTPEQRREIALKYATLPRGEKGPYATSLGVPSRTIITWISALADGDLDSGIFPRKTGSMTTRDTSEVHRLRTALADAEKTNQRLTTRYEKQLAEKDTENQRLNKAADALGKAIAVLHRYGDPSGKAEDN